MKRQSILDKAAELFAEQSFTGTSIAAIAVYCGVSKSLLYHYYDSKEALLFDMLNTHCTMLVQTGRAAVKHAENPADKLQSLIASLLEVYMHSRHKHVVLLNDLHCLPDEQQKQLRSLQRAVVQAFKDIISELKPAVSADECTALAMYLMGAINWTYTWFKPQGPVPVRKFADLSTSLFLSGINGL